MSEQNEQSQDATPATPEPKKPFSMIGWLREKFGELTPGNPAKGARYIADHPEEFGFSWGNGEIGKGTKKNYVSLRKDCPHIDVSPYNVPLFLATFGPKLVSDRLKGQSIKVACDRVNRDTLDKARSTSNETLKEKIVATVLLGQTTRTVYERIVTKTKWVVNGTEYGTEAEYKVAMAKGEQDETDRATSFVALAVEKGMAIELAIEMAKQVFPTANFGATPEEESEDEE